MEALNLASNSWAIAPLLGGILSLITFFDKITGDQEDIQKKRHTIAEVLATKRARATARFFSQASRWNPENLGGVTVVPGEEGGLHQRAADFWVTIDAITRKAELGEKRCSWCLRVKAFLPIWAFTVGLLLVLVGGLFPKLRLVVLFAGVAETLVVFVFVVWLALRVVQLGDLQQDAVFRSP